MAKLAVRYPKEARKSDLVDIVSESSTGYVRTHRDLKVYRRAIEEALRIKALTKNFPQDERFLLTSQINRSARSVCGNIAEAWRKRRYKKAFVSKLSDVEAECAETQTWLEIAALEGYISEREFEEGFEQYEQLIRSVTGIIANADKWTTLPRK